MAFVLASSFVVCYGQIHHRSYWGGCQVFDSTKEEIKRIKELDSLIYSRMEIWKELRKFNNYDDPTAVSEIIHKYKSATIDSTELVNWFNTFKASKAGYFKYRELKYDFAIREPAWELGFCLLDLDKTPYRRGNEEEDYSQEKLKYLISKIGHHQTAVIVYEYFLSYINAMEPSNTSANQDRDILTLQSHLKLLQQHIEYLGSKEYCQYNDIEMSNKVLKSVNILHDNDVFAPGNQDKNYTGGFLLEFTTDYFKMRLFPFINGNRVVQYQGLILGGEGYTSILRNVDTAIKNVGYDTLDRPWASFIYIGRTKYRQHFRLPIRSKSSFRIGCIGCGGALTIQSTLHDDLTVTSEDPYGWDKQIASGGRLAFQIDHRIEMSIFENNNFILNYGNYKRKRGWTNNVYSLVDLNFGNRLTAMGVGFGFSSLDFKSVSGNNDIGINHNFWVKTELRYQYVIHNTMLEGFGITKPYASNQVDVENIDAYFLQEDEVNRNLFYWNLFIGYRFKKTTIYYQLTAHNKEYFKEKAEDAYAWGTIGLNFRL